MRNVLAIARKELNVFLTTPIAYVIFCCTTVISSYLFVVLLQEFSRTSLLAMQLPQVYDSTRINLADMVLSPLVGNIGVVFIFVMPLLTMRLMAQERTDHTLELLMTAPISPTEIVLGKFLGAYAIVVLTLLFTLIYPVVLAVYGATASGASAVDWPTVASGYLGLLAWGAAIVSVGLFISCLTRNQAIAAIITFVFFLLTWMALGAARGLDGPAKAAVEWFSAIGHLFNLARGQVAVKDLLYFVTLSVLGLFLSQRSLESERWS
jgi:ABC-2 type transport system permease protein